jgi:carboxyl-terminal processing protease
VDRDKFYNNPDKAKGERYQQWLKNAQSDIYISETVNVVKDIISEENTMARH